MVQHVTGMEGQHREGSDCSEESIRQEIDLHVGESVMVY